MSTTVELVRANERYARLRAAVVELADWWDSGPTKHIDTMTREVAAARLRALLAAVDS